MKLETLDVEAVQPWKEQLIAVYTDVYGTDDPFDHPDRYRVQLDGHMKAPNWQAVLATDQGELTGYIYGFSLPSKTRWWEGMTTSAPEGLTEEDGSRTVAISELMVRLPWRGQGVARRLHDRFLAGRSEQRATLLVEQRNSDALAIYERWGWAQVAELRPAWEHAPLFDVMLLDLPVQASNVSLDDKAWMRRAIELSRECPPSEGAYSVGAVIVTQDGEEISTGYSREGNDPKVHAEESALAKLPADDPRLATATIYSTLEPCSVRSSRPVGCAQHIINAGISRVVIAWLEPSLFQDCEGVEMLEAAAVEVVELGELAEEAKAVNAHLGLT